MIDQKYDEAICPDCSSDLVYVEHVRAVWPVYGTAAGDPLAICCPDNMKYPELDWDESRVEGLECPNPKCGAKLPHRTVVWIVIPTPVPSG